jgi:DNA adenine methylase
MDPVATGHGRAREGKTLPFLRWAGSKRSHISALLQHAPCHFDRYFEPFLGGGSLFFALAPPNAVLGDACGELMHTYRTVRDDPVAVATAARRWNVDRETYYWVRDTASVDDRFQRAARFIYLNKTCWNGLWRVNASGRFNVPFGRPKTTNIVTDEHLSECAAALRKNVEIVDGDFTSTVQDADAGDFVFFDPPYVTAHNTNGFVDYNERLFRWSDQLRLASEAATLAAKGVHVVVTNADHPSISRLYDGFTAERLTRWSTIAGDSSKRLVTTELVFSSPTTGPYQ